MNDTISSGSAYAGQPLQYELTANGCGQFNIAGELEPFLSSPRSVEFKTPDCGDVGKTSQFFLGLLKEEQISLPLPSPKHTEEECKRGYIARFCCEHNKDQSKAEVTPLYCGKLSCKPSSHSLGNRRLKHLIDGTKKVNGESLGFKKLIEHYNLSVWVFTLPQHLRHLLYETKYLNAWNRANIRFLGEVYRANGMNKRGVLPIKCFFHPNGDLNPEEYKPHLNYLIPNVYCANGKIYKLKSYFPSYFFKERTWRYRYRQCVEEELGFSLFEGMEEKELNFFHEVRETKEERLHACTYFSRIFPNFARLNRGKLFNPRNIGLLNSKNANMLAYVLSQLDEVKGDSCSGIKGVDTSACEWIGITAVTEEALADSLTRWWHLRNVQKTANRHAATGVRSTADPPLPLSNCP